MTSIVEIVSVEGAATNGTLVSVGLMLDNGHVAWGDCIDLDGNSAESIERAIMIHIAPVLRGRKLTGFRSLASEVDQLTEQVTLVETIQPPRPPKPEGISRRGIFLGKTESAEPPMPDPIVREYEVTQPIFASVRYGVTQAILRACAFVQQRPLWQVIQQAYQLDPPIKAVPLMVELRAGQYRSAPRMLAHRIGALAVGQFTGATAAEAIGKQGEIVQRMVRSLKESALTISPPHKYKPRFFINLNGSYGEIYEHNAGKILGACVGLNSAVKPYHIVLEDPIVTDDRAAQAKLMADVKTYLRFRKVNVQLGARKTLRSLADVMAILEKDAIHVAHLDLPRLGGLPTAIEACRLLKDKEIEVVIGGSSAESAEAATIGAHVALALQPDFVLAKPASRVGIVTVQNEMTRAVVTDLAAKRT